jgi:uncharacterized membrane protein YhaH (DUF805 family)
VSFPDAVRSVVVENYFNFQTRARRSEYWWYALAAALLNIIARFIDQAIGVQIVAGLLGLALLLPGLGVAVRRLHDTGRSGFWLLIALTGVGIIVLIVFFVQDSQPGSNKYGASPKEAVAV